MISLNNEVNFKVVSTNTLTMVDGERPYDQIVLKLPYITCS